MKRTFEQFGEIDKRRVVHVSIPRRDAQRILGIELERRGVVVDQNHLGHVAVQFVQVLQVRERFA